MIPTAYEVKHNRYSLNLRLSHIMGHGPNVSVIFEFESGSEEISLQNSIKEILLLEPINRSTSEGLGRDSFALCVNHTREIGARSTGVSNLVELFDAKILLSYGDNVVRGFIIQNGDC